MLLKLKLKNAVKVKIENEKSELYRQEEPY